MKRRRSPFRCDQPRCDGQARWYLTSGPMFVCWQHKLHYAAQGEASAPLVGGHA